MDISPPRHFNLEATVCSSFLQALAPLQLQRSAGQTGVTLCLPLAPALAPQAAVDVWVHQDQPGGPLRVTGAEGQALPRAISAQVHQQLRFMLRLDEDLSLLYQLTDRAPELAWVRPAGFGRFLCAPTAAEDLIKALLYGTGSAALAQTLSVRLCQHLGPRTPSGRAAFPALETLAAQPARFFERDLGAGRLAARLHALVQRLHHSAYPESIRRGPWPAWDLDRLQQDEAYFKDRMREESEWSDRLEMFLLSLPGIGLRAAALLLPLCGCYDVATITGGMFAGYRARLRRHPPPRVRGPLSEDAAHRILARWLRRFAHYRGLALWLLLQSPVAQGASLRRPAEKNLRGRQPGLLITSC